MTSPKYTISKCFRVSIKLLKLCWNLSAVRNVMGIRRHAELRIGIIFGRTFFRWWRIVRIVLGLVEGSFPVSTTTAPAIVVFVVVMLVLGVLIVNYLKSQAQLLFNLILFYSIERNIYLLRLMTPLQINPEFGNIHQ